MAAALPDRPTRYAVHQPNFLPWCGYFAKIAAADTFVLLDDAQMPGGASYVSRVAVRKGDGSCWLTVPIQRQFPQVIGDVLLANGDWRSAHWNLLKDRYGQEPCYTDVSTVISPAYDAGHTHLAAFNTDILRRICGWLEIGTPLVAASSLGIEESGDERLARIGQVVGASNYLSGKGGEKYQQGATFSSHGIGLQVTDAGRAWERIDAPIGPAKGHSIFEAAAMLGREGTARLVFDLAQEMTDG